MMVELCENGEPARAVVKVSKMVDGFPLTLHFCKHHYEAAAGALVLAGWRIVRDERPSLAVTP
jgi:hypothetical protein